MGNNIDSKIKAINGQQTVLVLLLLTGWIVRFVACSQLKYMTDMDLFVAGFALFNSLNVFVFGVDMKRQKKESSKCSTIFAIFLTLFTCFFLALAIVCPFWVFLTFVYMFACERMTFANLTLTSNGIVGMEPHCPWSKELNRSSFHLNHFCHFNDQSVEMIFENDWRRRLGIYSEIITAIVIPVLMANFCRLCVLAIIKMFQILKMKANEQLNADANRNDIVLIENPPPPPYQETLSSADSS